MAETADDLLARMRAEAAAWFRAPVLSGERESAGGRLASAVLKLDELLSSGAPLPSGWTRKDADDRTGRHSFTRDQLIDALTCLEAYPATAGPGRRVFISAESMAGAIIEALEDGGESAAREGGADGQPGA